MPKQKNRSVCLEVTRRMKLIIEDGGEKYEAPEPCLAIPGKVKEIAGGVFEDCITLTLSGYV